MKSGCESHYRLSNRWFAYDNLSRLLSATNPDSGTTSYAYDNDSNVISRTRPQPNQTNPAVLLTSSYAYDELHRKRSVSYQNDLTGTPSLTFNYDETTGWGNGTLSNTNGKLSTEYAGSGPSAAAQFSYNPEARVTANWQCTPRTCGASAYYLPYGFDLLGDMISSQNGVGVSFGYSYNEEGKLVTMTDNYSASPSTLLYNVAYGPFGITSMDLGNGVAESMIYHQRGWLHNEADYSATTVATVKPVTDGT